MDDPAVLEAAAWTFAPDWRLPEHAHADRHELILICDGAMEARVGRNTVAGHPGTMLLYPAKVAHAEWSVTRKRLRMVYVSFSGSLHPALPLARSDLDRRCELLARWVVDTSTDDGRTRSALLQALLAVYTQPPATDRAMADRVRSSVCADFRRPVSLDDLAALFNLSPFHFARVFCKACGVPPMRFVRRLRVEAARSLLLASPLPTKAIAAAVGFRDEFELSRVFKRETGASPSQVRRRANLGLQ